LSAFWIDEGADSEAWETLSGAAGRVHSSRKHPIEPPPGTFMNTLQTEEDREVFREFDDQDGCSLSSRRSTG
jgi:hypothetical protein